MKLEGMIGKENAENLLTAGDISKLDYLTHSSEEVMEDYQRYCDNCHIPLDEQSAVDYLLEQQRLFDEGFESGQV